jgi:hypothetical protein
MKRSGEVTKETHGLVIPLVEGEPTDPQRRFSGCRSKLHPFADEGRLAETRGSGDQNERSVESRIKRSQEAIAADEVRARPGNMKLRRQKVRGKGKGYATPPADHPPWADRL